MATISAGQLMTTAEQEALAQVFRKAQGPAISSWYLALLTNAASGSLDNTWTTMAQVTEFSAASGYARQVFGPTTPTAASPSVISNTATITFGPLTTPSGTDRVGDGHRRDRRRVGHHRQADVRVPAGHRPHPDHAVTACRPPRPRSPARSDGRDPGR